MTLSLGAFRSKTAIIIYLISTLFFLITGLYSLFFSDKKHNAWQDSLLQELKYENPSAYERVDKFAQQYGERALKLTSHYYTHRYKESALDMLSRDLDSTRAETMVQLTGFFIDGQPYMSNASEDIYSLMSALLYKLYTNDAEQDNNTSVVSRFVLELNQIKAQGEQAWQTLCAHPFSLTVYFALQGEESIESRCLWNYYSENANWLADALTLLSFFEIKNEHIPQHQAETAHLIVNYIRLCERYPAMAAYSKNIVEQWNQRSPIYTAPEHSGALPDVECAITIPVIYSLFDHQGDILMRLHNNNAIPISECVDILLANNGVFLKSFDDSTLNELIDNLAKLYKEDKEVWDIICMETNALLLYQAHPEKSRNVLHSYQAESVADLIVHTATGSDGIIHSEALRNGVEAVSRYKELAIYILHQYIDDRRMHLVLNMDFRSIRYIQMKGEEGFTHLLSDKARGYLDKYLDDNGDPKLADPREDLLFIGAHITLFDHLRRGYPVSATEIGWAFLDTIEIIATAVSFGSAAIISSGVKSVIKKTAKEAMHVSIGRAWKGNTHKQAISFLQQTKSLQNRSRFLHGRLSPHVSSDVALMFNKIRIATSEATNHVIKSGRDRKKFLISKKLNKYRHKIQTTAQVWLSLASIAPQQSSATEKSNQSHLVNVTTLIESDTLKIGHIYSDMPSQKSYNSHYLFTFILLLFAIIFGLLLTYSLTHSNTIHPKISHKGTSKFSSL